MTLGTLAATGGCISVAHCEGGGDAAAALDEVSLAEVQQHLTEDDGGVWVIIDGLVYDVTEWHEDHPGGSEILLELAGKDATKLFAAVQHSPDAIEQRKSFVVGRLAADAVEQAASAASTDESLKEWERHAPTSERARRSKL